MTDIYFDNVIDVGKLYLEHVFYEFENEPILFSCTDEMKTIYFCLCSDIRYEQKWIIVKSNVSKLRSLINEEQDILSVFLSSKKAIVITMDIQGNENSYETYTNEIDRLDLPKEGIYIRCDRKKAEDYLWKKELEMFSGHLKWAIDDISLFDDIMKLSYADFMEFSINISRKFPELYAEHMNINFLEQTDRSSEMSGRLELIGDEYSICRKENYFDSVNSVDDVDIQYFQAA